MNNSANFYYGSYTGNIADTYIKNQGNFTFNVNSITFKLGNGFTAELTGNYRAREVYAYMDLKPNWYLNIGAQKKFKNNSTLKFSFNDIFFTSNPEARNVYSNYIENFVVRRKLVLQHFLIPTILAHPKTDSQEKPVIADDLKQRIGNG
ncbi:outer membrane beta-barrel protein [Chryseobacterium indoltheticum]|uniref:outer membrane beta-barrel protein n=1 Tax=Chryseobacterium indoltheticum TaxID=254 RepID=UPI003F4964EC